MHIPIPKSHFYHRPSAHARNYGKMHGSHPNFEKLTIDFMLGRHYKCAFYIVICGIFLTSLLSDLSLRVVTYDRTVFVLTTRGQHLGAFSPRVSTTAHSVVVAVLENIIPLKYSLFCNFFDLFVDIRTVFRKLMQ